MSRIKYLVVLIIGFGLSSPSSNAYAGGYDIKTNKNLRFIVGAKGNYFYYPPLNKPGQEITYKMIRDDINYKGKIPRDSLIPFSKDFIENHFLDKPGDTLMVINSGQKALAYIKNIGFQETGCSDEIICQLERIDTTAIFPITSYMGIALRENLNYSGWILRYVKYESKNPALFEIIDTLKNQLAKSDDDQRRPYIEANPERFKQEPPESCQNDVNAYVAESDSAGDSIFVTINCDFEESGWGTITLVTRKDKGFEVTAIQAPKGGANEITFDCAFDLNNDGTLEYLIIERYYETFRAKIFTISRGQWILIANSDLIGC
jgi:hypothetical protein